MPVISFTQELNKARQDHYAIPLFNVFDQFGAEGVYQAIASLRAPTIIGIYSGFATQPNTRAFTAYLRTRFADLDVPITIWLDHGASVDQCLQVIDFGFTDVMYDGSKLPLEENIANTYQIVQAAHARGVGVEAELGHVGSGDEYDQFGGKALGFTDPHQVGYFVEQTGVDFLAIAFGNAHGLYKGEPRLNLDLVKEISQMVSIPLVMHGGTGLSDDQFRGAISCGIAKINYATNIINAATDNLKKAAGQPDANMFTIPGGIQAAYYDWSCRLFKVFGTAGKA